MHKRKGFRTVHSVVQHNPCNGFSLLTMKPSGGGGGGTRESHKRCCLKIGVFGNAMTFHGFVIISLQLKLPVTGVGQHLLISGLHPEIPGPGAG